MSFDKKKDWDNFYFDQFLDLGDEREMHIRHEGNSVWLGAYPQTLKAESVSISGEPDENGVYSADGESYIKVKANPYDDDLYNLIIEFDNGKVIDYGKEYFFRIEPIEWEIVRRDGNKLTLISKRILDAARFDENTNDYSQSEIRAWLNGEFFGKAFSYYEKQLFGKENDNVRLLTLAELESEGVYKDKFDRIKKPTDYAKAQGCEVYCTKKPIEYKDSDWWWLQDAEERDISVAHARVAGIPEIDYPSTGDVEKDIETLFYNTPIEYLKICDAARIIKQGEGGVVPVIEIELPENFD